MVSKPMNRFHKGLPVHNLDQESNKADQHRIHQSLKYDLIHGCEIGNSQLGIENMPDAQCGDGQE